VPCYFAPRTHFFFVDHSAEFGWPGICQPGAVAEVAELDNCIEGILLQRLAVLMINLWFVEFDRSDDGDT
jgi:hypothetical protein